MKLRTEEKLRLQFRKTPKKGLPDTENYQRRYAMVLEMGPRKDGK